MEKPTSRNDPEVRCPGCGATGRWFAGKHGPFCSARCRWVDLGNWFGEAHRISRPLCPGDFEGFDELSAGPELDRTEGTERV